MLANVLPIVSVSQTDTDAAEAGADAATFTIARTGSTQSPLVVNFTLGGTAINGIDYDAVPLSVTIPIGAKSADVQIVPINDLTAEGTENVTLTITSSGAFNVGQDKVGSANIADDDGTSALIFSGGSTWRYQGRRQQPGHRVAGNELR